MNFVSASVKELGLKYLIFILVLVQFSCQKKISSTNTPNHGISLVETYWKVIEIGGKPVEKGFEGRELHFMISGNSDVVNGNTGCNSFSGKYKLVKKDVIEFSKVISTRMYCQNYEAEPLWFDLIESAMKYKIDGDKLKLTNKNNISAVCQAVFRDQQN